MASASGLHPRLFLTFTGAPWARSRYTHSDAVRKGEVRYLIFKHCFNNNKNILMLKGVKKQNN